MSERGAVRRNVLRWLVPIATIVLLAVFARGVDWAHAWQAVIHADPTLLAIATLANLASLAVKGIRWWLFLDAVGARGLGHAIRATFAGAALNNVLVANGGDAARVAAVARRAEISSAPVLATLAVDRLCDLITYALLFVVASFALSLPPALSRWRMPGLIALGVLAAIGAIVIPSAARNRGRPDRGAALSETSTAHSTSILQRARDYARRLVATSTSIATASRLTLAIALALVAWAGQWATFHYAAHAASFPVTAASSLLALLVVNASFLVRLTPGNVGVFQLLYVLAATSTGLNKDEAVAAAFLIQLIQYIPVTIVGLMLVPSLATRGRDATVSAASRSIPFDRDQSMRVRGEGHRGA